ncbi:MAG: transposase [Opitutales bacterium]|nr:transposase [Opitutales bacterium]
MDRRSPQSISLNLLQESDWQQLRFALLKIRNTQGPKKRLSDRDFLTAIMYLIQNRLSWRELPECFGDWNSIYVRFRRWEKSRTWAQLWRELELNAMESVKKALLPNGLQKQRMSSCDCEKLSIEQRLVCAVQMIIW